MLSSKILLMGWVLTNNEQQILITCSPCWTSVVTTLNKQSLHNNITTYQQTTHQNHQEMLWIQLVIITSELVSPSSSYETSVFEQKGYVKNKIRLFVLKTWRHTVDQSWASKDSACSRWESLCRAPPVQKNFLSRHLETLKKTWSFNVWTLYNCLQKYFVWVKSIWNTIFGKDLPLGRRCACNPHNVTYKKWYKKQKKKRGNETKNQPKNFFQNTFVVEFNCFFHYFCFLNVEEHFLDSSASCSASAILILYVQKQHFYNKHYCKNKNKKCL